MALSCQEGKTKANPAFFLLLMEQLGVRPEECVYVGDGNSHEMAMSKQLGMTPVLIEQMYAYCQTNVVKGYEHHIFQPT
jgi:FMN phosphatase YigB (HAD superfamily)